MMFHLLYRRLSSSVSRETRELHFAHEVGEKKQAEAEVSADSKIDASEKKVSDENVDVDAPVSATQAIKHAEEVRLQQVAQQRAALEAQGKLEKHADRPLTPVEHARALNGDFGEALLPFSTKTDNEYGVLHTNPSEKQKAFTLKVAYAEKAEIEKYIAEHKKEWDADQDVSQEKTISIAKRVIMGRLARIDEIERYNPNRRQEALAWREKQRVASETSEQEYQDTLESLWAAAPNERYPLPSGFETFIKDFAVPLFLKTQAARRTLEKTSTRSPVYETNRELYSVAKDLERRRIDMNYSRWRGTSFEEAFRNRYAQLQDDTSEYKRDLTRIVEPMAEEQKIAEFLESKGKGNAEKFKKIYGKFLYGNLSDFDRKEYLQYKGSAQAKTISQWEFDKKHFPHAASVSHEDTLPRLGKEVAAKLDATIDSIAADLQEQPAPTSEIAAGQCSTTAFKIGAALNALIRENSEAKSADILKVFLNEMKKMGPQRVKSVTSASFNMLDDDKAPRWYEFAAKSDGTFDIKNVNPVIEYKNPSPEERKIGESQHVVYRAPEEQIIDEEWQEYTGANNVELPESTPLNSQDSAQRQTDIVKNDIRELRDAESYRRATTLQKAVRYFDNVQMYESMNGMPVPERHRRQVDRMIRDLNVMFRDGDNSAVNSIAGTDVVSVIDHMEKYLKSDNTNLVPDHPVPYEFSQEKLSPLQEDIQMKSINVKSINGAWVDAGEISFGTPGWKYKMNANGMAFARLGKTIQAYMSYGNVDRNIPNRRHPEWLGLDEALGIDKSPLQMRKLFDSLVNRAAYSHWVKDPKDANTSYYLDLDEMYLRKKVGDEELVYRDEKDQWVKSE